MDPTKLLEQRTGLITEARTLHDTADKENRSLSADELEKFDKLMTDADAIKDRVDRAQRLDAEERSLAEPQPRQTRPETTSAAPSEDEERAAFRKYMLTGEVRAGAPWSKVDAEGGYMAPTLTAKEVIARLQNEVFMLGGSRLFPTIGAKAVSIPKLTTAPTAPAYGADGSETTADSATVFGAITLSPNKLSALTYISRELIQATGGIAESFLIDEMVKQMAEQAETGFVAGTGSGQPTGVFNETAALTGREVNGASATDVGYDDLVDAVGGVTARYRRNAAWLVHRDFVKRTMKLKDGEGRPLWQPSIAAGKPDMLFGFPVWESEYASNTFTTDKRVAVFGDFSRGYGIALSVDFRIQRLIERYAEFDAIGFLVVGYHDGNVLDENALVALHTA